MNWSGCTWLCIDTETTGIDVAKDRIVELGAVAFRQGEVLKRMGMLVDPEMPIPADATAIHGITDDDVADCPRLADIAERFLTHVRAAEVLVGYNWPFDSGLLEAALGDAWLEAIAGKPILDALVLVRFDGVGRFWKGPGRHRLDAVADRLEIAREGRSHRASSDCILTCRVLWKLREHLPEDAQEASARIAAERQRQDQDFEAWRRTQPAKSGDE